MALLFVLPILPSLVFYHILPQQPHTATGFTGDGDRLQMWLEVLVRDTD